jgi:Uma2 family endonuclease
MGLAAKQQAGKYTYKNYLGWDDGKRWEIIRGEAYDMTPAPVTIHQIISRELLVQIAVQLEDRTCEVFCAPFDVRIPLGAEKELEIENVVQPDIVVICDETKIDTKGCLGVPDFIIEILSPSTSRKDRLDKFNLYEEAGVKEYWLVSPDEKMVQVFHLGDDGKYGRPAMFGENHTVQLEAVNDLSIDLNPVFRYKLESDTGET